METLIGDGYVVTITHNGERWEAIAYAVTSWEAGGRPIPGASYLGITRARKEHHLYSTVLAWRDQWTAAFRLGQAAS